MRKSIGFLFFAILLAHSGIAEDGYRLWLRYDLITDAQQLALYRQSLQHYIIEGQSPTLEVVEHELKKALQGLLGTSITESTDLASKGLLILGTPSSSTIVKGLKLEDKLKTIGKEGFVITSQGGRTVIAANEDIGVLYGLFHFLRLLQSHTAIDGLSITNKPKLNIRILNHWDNLDRTVERGYAGFSIWDWHKLPDYLDARYLDYARANASIGINGTVLTNVNANALILRPDYLDKVAALADLFRPYGIRVYLTARFSAPINLGGLKTADPLDPAVKDWWKTKIDEIYEKIPDFGGFLVKANSEGQPGPQNYNRSHADGANMLADALKPHDGIVMWRAFVYDDKEPVDRAMQANNEFEPLDGTFRDNVLIQVKNGPIDFQPREPFHPLFGAMPKTPLMMEFQITQEYLGQATHLVYLGPMFEEVLKADTYAKGKGATVAKVIEGKLDNHQYSGMAGVANIGNDRNWTGHIFGQANWYVYGRLAWDTELSSAAIAEEWIRMTFSNDPDVIKPIKEMMLSSRETLVKYMTPLGLHHIMGAGHHYGPGPWVSRMSRADWTSVYYHKADSLGIGFDRTASGSNALGQYSPEVASFYSDLSTCPEAYLLWFHHLKWTYKMASGETLWEKLCHSYYEGAKEAKAFRQTWQKLEKAIDADRFRQVDMLLKIQEKEAKWWRDACVLYFQSFSKMPIPSGLEKPTESLEYFTNLSYPYAPGIRPRW
ncbi:MAG: alpha-glucuronidase family glycosyl hydrolase [Saprospiraceae bacterium]